MNTALVHLMDDQVEPGSRAQVDNERLRHTFLVYYSRMRRAFNRCEGGRAGQGRLEEGGGAENVDGRGCAKGGQVGGDGRRGTAGGERARLVRLTSILLTHCLHTSTFTLFQPQVQLLQRAIHTCAPAAGCAARPHPEQLQARAKVGAGRVWGASNQGLVRGQGLMAPGIRGIT